MRNFKRVRSEIGSEFWDVPVSGQGNDLFDEQTRWFLSGRSALMQILSETRQTSSKKAALPAWCCDSMILPFLDAGYSVSFYPVYPKNGGLTQELPDANDYDVVLVMDYFGFAGDSLPAQGSEIRIRDLTHSVLIQKYNDADYYFGSLRKWAGFWTGGFAMGCAPSSTPADTGYTALRQQAMAEKAKYLCGESNSKEFLDTFAHAEEQLDRGLLAGGDVRDAKLAVQMDADYIKRTRRANAAQLLEAFADIALFPELGNNDCPLFVPILVPDGRRDELRRHLIAQDIYCPVHWPLTAYHRPDSQSLELYKNELSLVCDQRYTPEDMARMIHAVKQFWKG